MVIMVHVNLVCFQALCNCHVHCLSICIPTYVHKYNISAPLKVCMYANSTVV